MPREYDNLLKYLAEHYPADIASWLLGKPITQVTILKSELSLQPIRADAVHLLELDDEILHVEFETDPTDSDPPLPLRLLDYFVRIIGASVSRCDKSSLCWPKRKRISRKNFM